MSLHDKIAEFLRGLPVVDGKLSVAPEAPHQLAQLVFHHGHAKKIFVVCCAQIVEMMINRMEEEPSMGARILAEAYHFVDHHWPSTQVEYGKNVYDGIATMAMVFSEVFFDGDVPPWLAPWQDCEVLH